MVQQFYQSSSLLIWPLRGPPALRGQLRGRALLRHCRPARSPRAASTWRSAPGRDERPATAGDAEGKVAEIGRAQGVQARSGLRPRLRRHPGVRQPPAQLVAVDPLRFDRLRLRLLARLPHLRRRRTCRACSIEVEMAAGGRGAARPRRHGLTDDALELMATIPGRVAEGRRSSRTYCVVCHAEPRRGPRGAEPHRRLLDPRRAPAGHPQGRHRRRAAKGMAAWGRQLGPDARGVGRWPTCSRSGHQRAGQGPGGRTASP